MFCFQDIISLVLELDPARRDCPVLLLETVSLFDAHCGASKTEMF